MSIGTVEDNQALQDDIELKELLTKYDYASLSPEDKEKKYGNILRLVARLHHKRGIDFLGDMNMRLAELGLPKFYHLVDLQEEDVTKQDKICHSRDNDDGTIRDTQYDRNGDVSYVTTKKSEDRTGVRTEQEIRDVLEYLQTVIRKDFRRDETRGNVIVYQERDVLEWLPADMIYERIECVITILKWVLNDPKYKYVNGTNVLDIIEGYY